MDDQMTWAGQHRNLEHAVRTARDDGLPLGQHIVAQVRFAGLSGKNRAPRPAPRSPRGAAVILPCTRIPRGKVIWTSCLTAPLGHSNSFSRAKYGSPPRGGGGVGVDPAA